MSEELQTQNEETNTQATDSPGENTQGKDSASPFDDLIKPNEHSAKEIAELDKFEKFKFDGKEWTPSDLKKAVMARSDYTKKSQEIAEQRKEYESELKHRDFRANLKADVQHVLKDPTLAEQFKKVYPEEYHFLLDSIKPQHQEMPTQEQKMNLPPEILEKLDKHERVLSEFQEKALETERQAVDARLDAYEAKFTEKYPHAKPALGMVYGALETYAVQNKISNINNVPESVFEQIYKNTHEQMIKLADQINNEKVKKQMDAHKEGQDVGRGGGTPGEAPKKIRLKDVAEHLIQDFNQ